MIEQKEKDRFIKVLLVMEHSTHAGEKDAAKNAAQTIAKGWDMSLQEAILFVRNQDNSNISDNEIQKRYDDRMEAWASGAYSAMYAHESQRKYAFEKAKQEAYERGLDKKLHKQEKKKATRYQWSRRYKHNAEDKMRLITALLEEGIPLKRIAFLAEATIYEVTGIYMLQRRNRQI